MWLAPLLLTLAAVALLSLPPPALRPPLSSMTVPHMSQMVASAAFSYVQAGQRTLDSCCCCCSSFLGSSHAEHLSAALSLTSVHLGQGQPSSLLLGSADLAAPYFLFLPLQARQRSALEGFSRVHLGG